MLGLMVPVVTIASVAIIWPVRHVRVLNAICVLGVPWLLAYCAYWAPVWLRPPNLNDPLDVHRLDMYGAWAGLEIGLAYFPAMLVSLVAVAITAARSRKRQKLA